MVDDNYFFDCGILNDNACGLLGLWFPDCSSRTQKDTVNNGTITLKEKIILETAFGKAILYLWQCLAMVLHQN